MNNKIPEGHSQEILKEMFKRVGIEGKEFKNFDFKKPQWFWDKTWTEEEQEDFRIWLGKFLVKNKYATNSKYRGQNGGYYQAGKFILNYGWKERTVAEEVKD